MKIRFKLYIMISFAFLTIFSSIHSYAHGPFDFLDPVTSRLSIFKDSITDCKGDNKCYEERKEIKQLCDKNSVDSSLISKYCIENVYKIPDHLVRKEVVKQCDTDYTCIEGAAKLYAIKPDGEIFLKQLKEIIQICKNNDYCVYTSHKIKNHDERKEIISLCNGDGFCTETTSKIKDHATRKKTITLCNRNTACIIGVNNISNMDGGYELVKLCQGSDGCIGTIGTLSYIKDPETRIQMIKSCNREESCIREEYNKYYNNEISKIKSIIETECKNELNAYQLYIIPDDNKRTEVIRSCKCDKNCVNESAKEYK